MKVAACLTALAFFAATHSAAADDDTTAQWNFRVLLDGSEIGYHHFRLREEGDYRLLESEARFDVKFLFFTAYRYRHDDVEKWQNGCVQELQAETVTNGKTRKVTGRRKDGAFVVDSDGSVEELPECVMTFAYWNPAFLEESRLLNPQTGKFLDVVIEKLPPEPLTVQGEERSAHRYRVTAKDIDIELWYSDDDRWLALETTVKGGRILRYELIG